MSKTSSATDLGAFLRVVEARKRSEERRREAVALRPKTTETAMETSEGAR